MRWWLVPFLGGVIVALCFWAGEAHGATTYSWPIKPVREQQPLRAGFLDIRIGKNGGRHYHAGIDVVVDGDQCSSQAPQGGCRRVFAISKGHAWWRYGARSTSCGLVRIAHFGYGHVMVRVKRGQTITRGQFIGWSCKAEWHVHISEFAGVPCRTGTAQGLAAWPLCRHLDPIRRGAPLSDPSDTVGPTITPVFEDGYVDAVVQDARNPEWMTGRMAHLYNDLPPARIVVNGVTLINAAWMAKHHPMPMVYAPEATRNVTAPICGLDPSTALCAGYYDFRLAPAVSGATVVVNAWDSQGNETTDSITVP